MALRISHGERDWAGPVRGDARATWQRHTQSLPTAHKAEAGRTITRDQKLLVGWKEVARTPGISLLPARQRRPLAHLAYAPLPDRELEGEEVARSNELLCQSALLGRRTHQA